MGSQLILHIGANKTGSTAIQSFLRLNWKALRNAGYLVPDDQLGVSGRVTGAQVSTFRDIFNRSDHATLASKIDALINSQAKCVVVSAENLANSTNFRFFEKILAGVDCKIVLYIRRQDEFITSVWRQWISKKETDFNSWLISALRQHGHWQRTIEGWENVAGEGKVAIRLFQKSDLVNQDVIDDFATLLGFEQVIPMFVKPPREVNSSYPDFITSLVSGSRFIFANEHSNEFYHMVAKLTGDHYIGQKKVSLISAAQRANIVEYYRQENDILCRKYFADREFLFEPVDHSQYEYLTHDEFTRRQFEFLASLIYAMYQQGNREPSGKSRRNAKRSEHGPN